jgi:hypothetical protein
MAWRLKGTKLALHTTGRAKWAAKCPGSADGGDKGADAE